MEAATVLVGEDEPGVCPTGPEGEVFPPLVPAVAP
jgi:hypothetical protein